ncbi:MAG: adenine nucleotide alpha hydrolase [Spirochaetes bacterium]|nr:adenine nucleotide alpha hydrolase [Spirochaetota bacterium]
MDSNEPVLLSWSGGKDCALALQEVRSGGLLDVTLFTAITEDHGRITMHGVREGLLDRQAASLGLPLEKVFIPAGCTDEEYGARMAEALERARERGTRSVIFGDIHLADVRDYRERQLAKAGMKGLYPLWGMDPRKLPESFISLGFRAMVVCADTKYLPEGFAGRDYDASFLRDLPPSVDPCGENGEFHTFVYDGPIFSAPVTFATGERVMRDGRFMYVDLVPPAT